MTTSVGYLGTAGPAVFTVERRCLVSARIQLLLVVLGVIVLAALNASTPWGP
jgi:hypothetical protein